jgi:hypothetical protein
LIGQIDRIDPRVREIHQLHLGRFLNRGDHAKPAIGRQLEPAQFCEFLPLAAVGLHAPEGTHFLPSHSWVKQEQDSLAILGQGGECSGTEVEITRPGFPKFDRLHLRFGPLVLGR